MIGFLFGMVVGMVLMVGIGVFCYFAPWLDREDEEIDP
jgi:hypothetical protein